METCYDNAVKLYVGKLISADKKRGRISLQSSLFNFIKE